MSIAASLDKNLPVPLYHQLQRLLQAEIDSGKWHADEQLPNEAKLAERFGVSKITVRQAMEQLVDLGYVRREQGRGTFITKRKFDEGPRELTSFTEEMKRHCLVASSRVLSQIVVDADTCVAHALGLPARSPVYVLKRVRLSAGEPVTVQTAHIPADFVPGLVMDATASLYDILKTRYDLYPARARETYTAAAADQAVAELLEIPSGSPVFAVERITTLFNERPFEFVQSFVRGDRYSIVLDLVNDEVEKRTLVRQTV
ncbi:MAG TPA: GntR family transcriptional regulator [Bryobacteraceae bacterium]|jgi:GntR family transcriptional regulator|nr:GntR family transcriptional regulator [Bryobacteraceae bacterium]